VYTDRRHVISIVVSKLTRTCQGHRGHSHSCFRHLLINCLLTCVYSVISCHKPFWPVKVIGYHVGQHCIRHWETFKVIHPLQAFRNEIFRSAAVSKGRGRGHVNQLNVGGHQQTISNDIARRAVPLRQQRRPRYLTFFLAKKVVSYRSEFYYSAFSHHVALYNKMRSVFTQT